MKRKDKKMKGETAEKLGEREENSNENGEKGKVKGN